MGPAQSIDAMGAPTPQTQPDRPGTHVVRICAIAGVAVAALIAILADWDSPLRVALAIVFFLFVPGLAVAELLGIDDLVQRLTIAIGASLGIETLVAVALLYAGLFSTKTACVIFGALTGVALAWAALRRSREPPTRGTDPHRVA